MADDDKDIEKIVLVQLIRLDALLVGLVFGIIGALGLFAATNFLILKGGENVGAHLSLLGQFFPGYSVTFVGSLIGAAYSFALAFVCGYVVARIYNAIVAWKSRKRGAHPLGDRK